MSGSRDDLCAWIGEADDFTVMLMFDTFLRSSGELGVELDDLVLAVGPSSGFPFAEVAGWIDDDLLSETPLGRDASARLCRSILIIAAMRLQLRPLVAQAVSHPIDCRLQAGVTVRLGAVAGALLLVASTSFEIKVGGVTFRKDVLSAETISALADLVKSLRVDLSTSGSSCR